MRVNQTHGGIYTCLGVYAHGRRSIKTILHETKEWDYVSAVKKRYSVK